MTDQFVVAVPVADIHRDPDPQSEVVTQALLNVPALAGEVSGDWTYVTLSDYQGWIRSDELELPVVRGYCEDGEGACGVPLPYSVVVTATHTPLYVYEQGANTWGDIYLATALPAISFAHSSRLHVACPGEREGWIERTAVDIRNDNQLFPRQDISVMLDYARAFLDVPYLWGGTSWRGIDCSGLVQLCYRMGGYILPRDADQQWAALSHDVERSELQPGDLLFFGREQITHVAIALNAHSYLHAEGQRYNRVLVSSLNADDPNFYDSLAEKIFAIKRVVVP